MFLFKRKCKKLKLLFVLKKRIAYGISFGLKNSCHFVCKELENHDIDCRVSEVIDANGIDKAIHDFRPDYVIIEAIWCPAEKFKTLFKLHPYVKKWSVRLHSRVPFLSNEGMALSYLNEYQNLILQNARFNISVNHTETQKELLYRLKISSDYLPNIYPFEETGYIKDRHPDILDISSFGAIRPQKNILIQAMAAIKYADKLGKTLHFHVNSNRNEQTGENTLKNLVSLFDNEYNRFRKHRLFQHDWLNHSEFIRLVRKMDICMGVSNTETFCITIMDAVVNNIPVVTSDVVEIIHPIFQANPNQIDDIISRLDNAYCGKFLHLQALNKYNLKKFNKIATKEWINYVSR